MPDPNEKHMELTEEKLRLFLTLADEMLSLRQAVEANIDHAFRSGDIKDTKRNGVLVGLSMKALDSFDRLVVDARDKRGECSHHLKTMAEVFIYSHWVSADASEERARLLRADSFRSRAAYHENCSESDKDKEWATEWRKLQHEETAGIEAEWKQFKNSSTELLASQANMQDEYYKIYRLACEAAHMGDLFVYQAPQPEEKGLTISDISIQRSYVSLKFGIHLACDLLHDASDALGMKLDTQIDSFRKRSLEIQSKGS